MFSQLQKVTAKKKLKLFSILYSHSHIYLHAFKSIKVVLYFWDYSEKKNVYISFKLQMGSTINL